MNTIKVINSNSRKYAPEQLLVESSILHVHTNAAVLNDRYFISWGYKFTQLSTTSWLVMSENEFCNDTLEEFVVALEQDCNELTITRF